MYIKVLYEILYPFCIPSLLAFACLKIIKVAIFFPCCEYKRNLKK